MAATLFHISNLGFAYDDFWVIKHFTHQISPADLIHLRGENGSGKSTLLKLLAGILNPAEGEIRGQMQKSFNGHSLGLHPDLSVLENLTFGFNPINPVTLNRLLEETQLKSKKHHSLRTLSKGQGQKVALIASILQEPKLWLMDEPFANLDQVTEAWLWEKIKEMLTSGSAVIFTAHQRDFSQQGAKIWQL